MPEKKECSLAFLVVVVALSLTVGCGGGGSSGGGDGGGGDCRTLSEREPNDGAGIGGVLGTISPGSCFIVQGRADEFSDQFDGNAFRIQGPIQLDFRLNHPGDADYDLLFVSRTVGDGVGTPCDGVNNPEVCAITFAGGSDVLEVVVLAFDGAGPYTLRIEGSSLTGRFKEGAGTYPGSRSTANGEDGLASYLR